VIVANTDESKPWLTVLIIVAFFYVLSQGRQDDVVPDVVPDAPDVATGLLPDVRLTLDPAIHSLVREFIQTGKISSGRAGVSMTSVDTIRCEPGRLIFNPPIDVKYDGPGFVNVSTTVKEIRVTSEGAILIDVVNSPVDVIVIGESK
jgi:hypothetical protein